jgi:hypothetical protein
MAEAPAESAARRRPVTPRVFVSRPSVLSTEQEDRLREWLHRLELLELESVALDRDAYDIPPWDQIRSVIKGADGLLILGFRQLRVTDGVWRPDTIESRDAAPWWATPWNQIEAAFGLMAGIPVLVAHEPGVTEGVFSADVWGRDLFGVRLDASVEAANKTPTATGGGSGAVVTAWARAVKERVFARTSSSA